MKKKCMILLGALSLASSTFAQTWIWYPGDYEIWLGNQMNNRRTERGAFFPPFWKTDSHYVVVEFSKVLNLSEPEEVFIAAEGTYNVKLDGKLQFGTPETLLLPAGKHSLNIKVWNQATPPTIYVKGKTVNSDSSSRVVRCIVYAPTSQIRFSSSSLQRKLPRYSSGRYSYCIDTSPICTSGS